LNRRWPILLALAIAAATVGLVAEKEHVAQQFDVTAVVGEDGSLEVVERIAFRFTGGEFTKVTRELRSRETDGVTIIEAGMDGRVLRHGEGVGQVEIDRGGLRVVWRFPPARDAVHVFSLRYRYAGVVRYGEGEDWFRWPPFPTDFDYPIEAGSVRLTWPEQARPRRQPDVEGASASTSHLGNGIAVTVANYRQRDADVRVTVRFEPGAFPGPEPQWQRDTRRADRLAPAFIAAGLMIFAATALLLWLFFLRYRRDPSEGSLAAAAVTSPPDDLRPALAGAISRGRLSVGGGQLLGAVFDLARRGILKIDERPATGLMKRREFVLRKGPHGMLREHEQAVVDALFKPGESEARFDKSLSRLAGKSSAIGKVIGSEFAQMQFIDEHRREGRRALTISGVVVIALSTLLALVAGLASQRLGDAALLIPVALGVSGLAMLISAASFSTLSRTGLASARRWDAFRRHIAAESKQGRAPADGEAVGRLLPYAAALGVLAPFGKALEKTDVRNVPAWLRTLDGADGSATMMAIIMAGSHSATHGGSSAGGASAGVGSGGSSSAS
jgi:hypothetical protein